MSVGPDCGVEHGKANYAAHVVGFDVLWVFVDQRVLGYEVVVGLDGGFR